MFIRRFQIKLSESYIEPGKTGMINIYYILQGVPENMIKAVALRVINDLQNKSGQQLTDDFNNILFFVWVNLVDFLRLPVPVQYFTQ